MSSLFAGPPVEAGAGLVVALDGVSVLVVVVVLGAAGAETSSRPRLSSSANSSASVFLDMIAGRVALMLQDSEAVGYPSAGSNLRLAIFAVTDM